MESVVMIIVFGLSLLSLAYAAWLAREVLRSDTGSEAMRVIAAAIKEGAEAFLKRQYKTIGMMSVVVLPTSTNSASGNVRATSIALASQFAATTCPGRRRAASALSRAAAAAFSAAVTKPRRRA